jgi:hypothetical protein
MCQWTPDTRGGFDRHLFSQSLTLVHGMLEAYMRQATFSTTFATHTFLARCELAELAVSR